VLVLVVEVAELAGPTELDEPKVPDDPAELVVLGASLDARV
jgi:hypothetical protein